MRKKQTPWRVKSLNQPWANVRIEVLGYSWILQIHRYTVIPYSERRAVCTCWKKIDKLFRHWICNHETSLEDRKVDCWQKSKQRMCIVKFFKENLKISQITIFSRTFAAFKGSWHTWTASRSRSNFAALLVTCDPLRNIEKSGPKQKIWRKTQQDIAERTTYPRIWKLKTN